jgi:hypothetical protein
MSSVILCKYICYLLGVDCKEWIFYYFNSTLDHLCNACSQKSRHMRYKYKCDKCKATFCIHHFIKHQKYKSQIILTSKGKHIVRCKDDTLYIFKSENISLKMSMHLHFTALKIVENNELNISVCCRRIQMITLQKIIINKFNIAKFTDLLAFAYNLSAIGICLNRIGPCRYRRTNKCE